MSSLNQNVIRHKIGLLNLATELGNVSKACKVMGLSRDTFYRYQNAVAEGGVEALFDGNRRKPNPKNRVEESTETAVLAYATEQPAHGQVRTSNELRQRGIFVSPSGVRSIWLRNDLASFKQRLAALEKQVAEQGILLTDAQVAALERKQDDDLAHGEIETAHPGYLGSQDTFYVGTIKGVGRIYQQTFVDTHSKTQNLTQVAVNFGKTQKSAFSLIATKRRKQNKNTVFSPINCTKPMFSTINLLVMLPTVPEPLFFRHQGTPAVSTRNTPRLTWITPISSAIGSPQTVQFGL